MGKTTTENARQVLLGFLAAHAAAELELHHELDRVLRRVAAKRFPFCLREIDDVVAECFAILWRWRNTADKEALVRPDEPLVFLARRLLEQVLQKELNRREIEQRHRDRMLAENEGGSSEPTVDDEVACAAMLKALAGLTVSLTPDLQKTFEVVARTVNGGGGDLAAALETTPQQVRKKLYRLRTTLAPLALEAGLLERGSDGRLEVSDEAD